MKKIAILLAALIVAIPAIAQVSVQGIPGGNVQIGGGGGGQGTIQGGVFIWSFSGLYDDGHASNSGPAIAVASTSVSSGTVTVTTVAPHGLSSGDFVDVTSLTNSNSVQQSVWGNGSFKISVTGTTTFAFTSSVATACASSCGNVYLANYWAFYQTINQPFLKGAPYAGIEDSIADMVINFNTNVGPYCHIGSPNSTYFIIEAGQNDLSVGTPDWPTLEADLLSIYAQAHACGMKVIQGSIVAGSYGGFPLDSVAPGLLTLNLWMPQQAKSNSNASSGQYWDGLIDYNAYMFTQNEPVLPSASASLAFAQLTNAGMSNGGSLLVGFPPLFSQFPTSPGGQAINTDGAWNFYRPTGHDSSTNWGNWMQWKNGQIFMASYSEGDLIDFFNSDGSADYCPLRINAITTSSGNQMAICQHYVSSGSLSNYVYFDWPGAAAISAKFFADDSTALPPLGNGTGDQYIGVDLNGKLKDMPTPGGGGLNGTVTYTSSHTATTSDNGKLMIFNCSSACALTLPGTQPSGTWQAWVQTIGSTDATITLGGGDTYNSGASVPTLLKFDVLAVWADSTTATNYEGGIPDKAGTNVTITPAANNKTIASTGGSTTVSTFSCADTSGSNSAQNCTAVPTLSSVGVNTCIAYTTTTANSGTLTLNVSSLTSGAHVKKWGGSADLASGDMPANKSQQLCYDGTSWDAMDIGNAPSGGGGSGNYVNITSSASATGCTISGGTCTVGSAVASVTISSIPSGYLILNTDFFGSSASGSNDALLLQFNGDTGSHYWSGGGCGLGPVSAATTGQVTGIGSSASPEIPTIASLQIPNYTGTTFRKSYAVTGSAWQSPSTGCSAGGMWNNGDTTYPAITSILFKMNSGSNIAAGTTFTLYGKN